MSSVFDFGAAIGADINRLWAATDRHLEALPDIALTVLGDRQPHNELSIERVAADLASDGGLLPRQHGAGNAGFGDPPVTLFHDPADRFFIELYVWSSIDMTIHDHPFTGAFSVLAGECRNDSFSFEGETVYDDLEIGRLTSRGSELLRPGHSMRITNERSFIHRNVHIGQPSMTMVVRTLWDGCRGLIYDEAGVAVDPALPALAAKQLDMLQGLLRIDEALAMRFFLQVMESPVSAAWILMALKQLASASELHHDQLVEVTSPYLGEVAHDVVGRARGRIMLLAD